MVVNQDISVYGINNIKEADLRSRSKLASFYGFNFPLGEDSNSDYFQLISGKKLYNKNLSQLLKTNQGERFMRPEFGLNLKRFLFEPKIPFIITEIKDHIRKQITKHAPYLEINDIEIISKDKSQAGFVADLIVKVKCSVKSEDKILIEVNIEV